MACERSNTMAISYKNGGEGLAEHYNQRCIDDPMEMDSITSDNIDFQEQQQEQPMNPINFQSIPKSSPSSEPIHYQQHADTVMDYRHQSQVNHQVDELLEGWPSTRRTSMCSVNTQDWQSLCQKLHPRVTFSEQSSMHIYRADPHYVRTKSYTKEERRNFSSQTLQQAIRIKRLVLSTPGCTSTKDSFKYLLKNKVIGLEEIVGLEHLVLGKSASKLMKERREHVNAVVREQGKQKYLEYTSNKMKDVDHQMVKLGEFSESRSVKSVKRAKIRAAMAA